MTNKQIIIAALLVSLSCLVGTACATTQQPTQPDSQDPLVELSRHHFRVGKADFQREDYPSAIKNFKIACELDPQFGQAQKYLRWSEFVREKNYWADWQARHQEEQFIHIHWVHIGKHRTEWKIEFEVGMRLFALGMYKRAREILAYCLEFLRWFPYPLDLDSEGQYECVMKSAIDECDRKLKHQNGVDK